MQYTSFKPDYVPPHLEGRVSDFRRDENGGVSFFDPRSAAPDDPDEPHRTGIDQETYDYTFGDKRYNLPEAADKQYGLGTPRPTMASSVKNWIADVGRKGVDYGLSSPAHAMGAAGLLSALAGGTFGMLGEDGSLGRGLLYALLAGGAGAGAVAIGQDLNANRERRREEAMAQLNKSAFADTDLLSLLASTPSITDADRQRFIDAAAQLSAAEKIELSRLLRTVSGAAVGVLITRYLVGKGLLPSVLGGMLGAFVGRMTAPQPIYNSFGQLSTLNLR